MNQTKSAQLYLDSPELVRQLDQTCDYIVSADDIGEAKRFLTVLAEIFAALPDLKKISPSAFSIYHGYLVAAEYVILYELEEKEIVQLLHDEFKFVLEHPNYDLERKVRYKITNILDLEQRDIFKKNLRDALLKCQATFGPSKINISGLNQEATIANWLKDYYMKVGIEKADPLKVNEYLINSSNIKALSEEKKIQLKKIFSFFENLKISSVEFPTYEEDFGAILPDGELQIIREGQPEKIGADIAQAYKQAALITGGPIAVPAAPAVSAAPAAARPASPAPAAPLSPIAELERALDNYPSSSLEHKAISQEISRLKVLELKKAQQKTNVRK